jgi:hypothetical protein
MSELTMPRANGHAVSRDLNPILVRTDKLRPLGQETRRHPRRQLDKLAASIDEYGFVVPIIIIDVEPGLLPAGALCWRRGSWTCPKSPAVTLTVLDEAKLRILRLALDRLGRGLQLGHGSVNTINLSLAARVAMRRLLGILVFFS